MLTVTDEIWTLPETFTTRMAADPAQAVWAEALPAVAADLASRWQLRRDGAPWSGYMSTVWPVRTADGISKGTSADSTWGMATADLGALKISWLDDGSRAEPLALRAWAGLPAVGLLEHDESRGAMLLQRLDGDRTLQDLADIDQACTVIGTILASLTSVTAPSGVPPLEVEVERIASSIVDHCARHPGLLPGVVVEQALTTLRDLVQDLGPSTHRSLVHGDCHFLNVLHTVRTEAPAWLAIDPLPSAGIREWDVTALLRNRWEDALAAGDPDAALRRRVDLVAEIAQMDQVRVRAIAQAVAVDNLLWLLPRDPQNMFVPPYQVMSTWTH